MKKLILLTFLLVSACKSEDVRPSVAEQIEEFINNRKVERVIVAETLVDFYSLAFQTDRGKFFKIDRDFITIDGVSWNLNQLKSYQIIQIPSNDFVMWLQI